MILTLFILCPTFMSRLDTKSSDLVFNGNIYVYVYDISLLLINKYEY